MRSETREFPGRFYSAAETREIERRAIGSGDGYALMQRAGAAAWRELLRRWPRAQRIVVLCGPGNNGGDGYEVARLARGAGLDVTVLRAGAAPAKGAAVKAFAAFRDAGGAAAEFRSPLPAADVVVDALFGIGLTRAPQGAAHDAILAIEAARAAGAGVLAIDVPSGLDADRGATPGDAVRADVTVTFVAAKPGLYTGVGPDHAGRVVFDDLGVAADGAGGIECLRPALLAALLPRRARTSHKGDMGHVLLAGGEHGMAGAILLAGRSALRAGAGWVSVATRAAHAAALTAAQPELMCHGVEEPRALRALLERASVLALGPGLGRGDWGRELFGQALEAPQPLVIDADGLNWLAENPQRRDDWILTPHPGEAARLLGSTAAAVQADRPAAAHELQRRYGGVAVLKGAGTLVQGRALALCPYGNPGMAVGGTGDVLCGIIAGLLAQGLGAEAAARAGVLLHALAGDRAAARGERGLIPGDLIDELRPWLNPADGTP